MLPKHIQGGMGVGVSEYPLVKAVCRRGLLGTLSGVAADILMVRRLQNGDPGGHYRRAMAHFPFPAVAEKILRDYFVEGGIPSVQYKRVPGLSLTPSPRSIELLVVGNFTSVWLAKEGHDQPVSINWLEKMQMAHLYSIAGAMLAGVDVVTMGAGIPRQIPRLLEDFSEGRPTEYEVTVTGSGSGSWMMRFDPREFFGSDWPVTLRRPAFLPIVSSNLLAKMMVKKVGGVDGLVFEGYTAGGHNAPPRVDGGRNEIGELVYGVRDEPDFELLNGLGVPFWLAGGYSSPVARIQAESVGGGTQVGSLFALCAESGLDPVFKQETIQRFLNGELWVRQDPTASPTRYPFQVVQRAGSLSDQEVFDQWAAECSVKGLRTPHRMPDAELEYRCPAEPRDSYLQKGGQLEETLGARCLCRGLFSAIQRGDPGDAAIFTLGRHLDFLNKLAQPPAYGYTADQAIDYYLGPV